MTNVSRTLVDVSDTLVDMSDTLVDMSHTLVDVSHNTTMSVTLCRCQSQCYNVSYT
jgi:hypothetical protein